MIFFKINLFAFVYNTRKLFLKMYFHGFTVFPCILFYCLDPILGFPEDVQSLINCKCVIKEERKRGLRHPCMCDLHSLRHLNRLWEKTFLHKLFQQHGVQCESLPFSLQGQAILCNQVICVCKVREPSLCAPAVVTPPFFHER